VMRQGDPAFTPIQITLTSVEVAAWASARHGTYGAEALSRELLLQRRRTRVPRGPTGCAASVAWPVRLD
jgi:hypothetical protein